MKIRGIVAAVMAIVLSAALIVGAPTSATAAPRHGTGYTFTVPAGVASLSTTVHGMHVSAVKMPGQVAQAATCTVDPQTPFRYYGGPYGGGIEGLVEVTCTAVMYALEAEVALFLNGTQITYNYHTLYEVLQVSADTEYPLASGQFMTGADAYSEQDYNGTVTFWPIKFSPAMSF
jgi:hypothetical protein